MTNSSARVSIASVFFLSVVVIDVKRVMGEADNIDPICLKKIQTIALPAWQNAEESTNDVEIVCHEKFYSKTFANESSATPIVKEDLSDWRISSDLAKKRRIVEHEYLMEKNKPNYGFHVSNDKYKFAVGQVSGGLNPKYQLANANQYNDPSEFEQLDGAEITANNVILGTSHCIEGLDMRDLLVDKDFTLVSAYFVGEGPVDQKKVRMEWRRDKDSGAWNVTGAKYWAELGPSTGWLIGRCGISHPEGMTYKKDIEYQASKNGLFPKKVVQVIDAPKEGVETTTFDFETPHGCTRPDDEYFLSHYNIPESVLDVTRTSSWVRNTAIFLSMLGVALSIYLYRSSRRPSGPKVTSA